MEITSIDGVLWTDGDKVGSRSPGDSIDMIDGPVRTSNRSASVTMFRDLDYTTEPLELVGLEHVLDGSEACLRPHHIEEFT